MQKSSKNKSLYVTLRAEDVNPNARHGGLAGQFAERQRKPQGRQASTADDSTDTVPMTGRKYKPN